MKRHELEEASFWGQSVCADCEAVFDPEDAGEGSRCPECGSAATLPAVKVLDLVEEPDE